ncbi:hypothetical protein PRUPE_3G138700 [Prunus persica]|uniref:Uncharacterized protein n=1 Tax=Prunus persica TaxID=3760 RepID=A0A251PZW4_PRUPE|nr:hypothetical protein PRUPE_3G138700 [Prunus persica]
MVISALVRGVNWMRRMQTTFFCTAGSLLRFGGFQEVFGLVWVFSRNCSVLVGGFMNEGVKDLRFRI